MTSRGALRLSDKDNVATSLENIESGVVVLVRLGRDSEEITALERIPFGFKIAVTAISKGAPVIKYGEPIGIASQDIKKGQLVHVHNIEGARGRGDLTKGGLK
ncbi:MAG: UxaA family hydrolase [Desulfobacteraceae bacterium]|nr:UxaA family hydrolase [Desulfobacteraceae bacterium]